MKQNFNSFNFLIFTSSVVFATGLFAVAQNNQKEYDKRYTTSTKSKQVFMKQIDGLNNDEQDQFMLGRSFFTIPWVEAPSATTARDGLGPMFSANTCVHCHPNNASGSVYTKKNEISRSYISRLSIPSNGSVEHKKMLKYNGFVQEPIYGAQVSINAVEGVPYEAKQIIKYKNINVTYFDNETAILKQPLRGVENQLIDLQYGKINHNVSITNRLAPALVGLGLIEQISDKQILLNEDIEDKDNDGISGKANIVYSIKNKDFRVGRYTWKGSAPSVIHQTAAAASNDMSLTNDFFPNENCTIFQNECLKALKGGKVMGKETFDLPIQRLEAITFYLNNLKIPKSVISEKEGEILFEKIGCVKCHIPSFKTNNGYNIKPFTDFLLHDMGEGLSDGRVEFKATAQEWKTAPLWGIGKYKQATNKEPELLHDGRAKT
ncbi:MAG: CxxC motif-containing protein (DUF1111 family), partial [Arcobacteraceae bacterium]